MPLALVLLLALVAGCASAPEKEALEEDLLGRWVGDPVDAPARSWWEGARFDVSFAPPGIISHGRDFSVVVSTFEGHPHPLRFEGTYDQPITQRWIAQPRAELDLAAQDVRELGVGAGLSSFELELRLRYEIRRELAPYLGVSWQRKVGETAHFARRDGERESSTSFVLGLKTWF